MGFACNGHKSGGRCGVEPHDDQRPFPRSLITGLLHDGIVDLSFPILSVDHIEITAMISCNADFAASNAFSSSKERLKAFQRRMFGRVVQTGHNRDSQFFGTDAVGIKVE